VVDDVVNVEAACTRSRFLAGGGTGLFLLAGGANVLGSHVGVGDASAEPRAVGASVAAARRFVSRPDLRPPAMTVVRAASGTANGHLFLAPSSGPGQRGVLIVDNDGEPVWFHPTAPRTAMAFRAGYYRGKPVLTWWEGKHEIGVGKLGHYVMVDESYREIARFPAGHKLPPDFHEFLLTPNGTALVTVYDPGAADLTSVGGPAWGEAFAGVVQELEIPSGRLLFEWRSLDHVDVAETYSKYVHSPFDYFHINSVGFDRDGHLLISARNTWAVYKVHRRTGEIIWRLGGKKSDFAMGRGTVFAWQHDARSHGNGRLISVFDNGAGPQVQTQSRALLIALDTVQMRATLVRKYTHRPGRLISRFMGNAQVLRNRNVLVGWGSEPFITEFAPGGGIRFDARLPEGSQNYRVFRFPWVGSPSEPPRLARAGREAALYASWNGATEVAAWQLLSGARKSNLQPASTTPRSGFETKLTPDRDAGFAAVVALDRRSKPLAKSNVIRL
jgi:hypothetical protein